MIKPPAWCSKAVATPKGWKHHARREILLGRKFTQEQCDEYNTAKGNALAIKPQPAPKPAPKPAPEPTVQVSDDTIRDLNEDGVIDDLESLTKKELEDLGREHGVELDRRKNKKSLVESVRGILSK